MIDLAISKGLPGLDGELPQVQLTQVLHGWLDMVFLAYRNTTAGQNQIMVLRCIPQGRNRGLALVRHDAKVCDLTAQALQHGAQKETVRVVNCACWHVLRRHSTGHDQLIPR